MNNKIKSFENNVADTSLIYDSGGTMPINRKGIGTIKHDGNKDIEIQFRECRISNRKKGMFTISRIIMRKEL